jgi:hypothetical protein
VEGASRGDYRSGPVKQELNTEEANKIDVDTVSLGGKLNQIADAMSVVESVEKRPDVISLNDILPENIMQQYKILD